MFKARVGSFSSVTKFCNNVNRRNLKTFRNKLKKSNFGDVPKC
jgi:hypothetical protein